jgi:hypothetical protein
VIDPLVFHDTEGKSAKVQRGIVFTKSLTKQFAPVSVPNISDFGAHFQTILTEVKDSKVRNKKNSDPF